MQGMDVRCDVHGAAAALPDPGVLFPLVPGWLSASTRRLVVSSLDAQVCTACLEAAVSR